MRYLFLLTVLLFTLSVQAHRSIIHCGNFIDGNSNVAQAQMTIIVDGNKIVGVEKGYINPKDGESLIDLRNKTVMPGLIDLHVHLESETNKDYNLQKFTLNDADIAFRSALFAKRTLLAGFTTVRDLGGVGVNISLRNAINQVV